MTEPVPPVPPVPPVRPVRFGAQLWSQATDWPGFLAAALAAEDAGWDSVWTWDHLHAIFGPWEQPLMEGWLAMGAVAARTSRVGVGLMVGANTFRNPGHTAKLAATLDHVSGGRATLGIGGAWFAREHQAFGIDFGSSVGERLDRLDEAVEVMRRLLDGERFSHAGRHSAIVEIYKRGYTQAVGVNLELRESLGLPPLPTITNNPEQLELFQEMLMKTQIVSDNDYMFKG